MNKTIAFLKKNGFKKMEQNSYANEFCNIVLEKNHYVVTNNSWGTMYSNDLNIYEPLKGKKWLEACKVASETIKALAIIAGQWPHSSYMIPGGVMSDPTKMDLINMQNYLQIAINFFEDSIVDTSLDNYLSFSSFDKFEKIGGDLKNVP